ncbi:cobalamin synthase [Mesorhizobium sp. Root554]|uniref:adenosylcobinamide-GDP ribazoletransferase n=1 Tax=unclassified Mesorhizobium TaxID=325217 RepID=UPI0006FA68F2|nr:MULTISPECIES: adenosylcobinamide-GDP ribazoletransferase [unclassified Mesorhizobium]KQZ13942.1 cobalamin synthase [Mesorhizobium sp. Root1471]KQZ36455.1 cobalamin synthase [Mesorhizobium sp. Root554]
MSIFLKSFAPRDILLCLVFFTRLPLPSLDFRGRTLAQAIWAAPITGIAIGLIAALVYAIAKALGLAAGPAAALALATDMLVTGCLHEDGLSDVADGFGGGRTRERKLEIMRDSRIGAYGACALALSLLLRWTALAEIGSAWFAVLALVGAHGASRGLLGAFMHRLPPAREDGLSANAGMVGRETAMIGLAIGVVLLLPLGLAGAIIAAIVLALVFFGFRALCQRQIGGQTGDAIGALQQAAEISILLVASVCLA